MALALPYTCACGPAGAHSLHHPRECSAVVPAVEPALLGAVFGGSLRRRAMLRRIGAATAMAVLETMLPVGDLAALAAVDAPPEKRELTLGFIAITCAAPLLVADEMQLFREVGLDVELVRTPGWSVVRDRLLSGDYDGSHILSPMPLMMSLNEPSRAMPVALALMQNVNGQAITLARAHADRRDPKGWGGLSFAVPDRFSMHNLLLRAYLAQAGLDPDRDVTLRYVPPPELVPQLKAGVIDGFLGPEPFNQLAVHEGVGFIHMLSRELWPGHPCCGFGVSRSLIETAPNTYLALTRAVAKAALFCHETANRPTVAARVAQAKYLPQPAEVIEQVMTGHFSDGLGTTLSVPDRIDFAPLPDPAFAVWMLTQLRRWKMVGDDFSYADLAERVFRAADARSAVAALGGSLPPAGAPITMLGRVFDPHEADRDAAGIAVHAH